MPLMNGCHGGVTVPQWLIIWKTWKTKTQTLQLEPLRERALMVPGVRKFL